MTGMQALERADGLLADPALQHVHAGDLATKRHAFGVFASQPSARAITIAATALVAARVGLGEAGRGEVIAPLVTVVLAGPVEWVVHRDVLHGAAPAAPRCVRWVPATAATTSSPAICAGC